MKDRPDNPGAGGPSWEPESNIDVEHSGGRAENVVGAEGPSRASESCQKDILEGKLLC